MCTFATKGIQVSKLKPMALIFREREPNWSVPNHPQRPYGSLDTNWGWGGGFVFRVIISMAYS
jgi:hypothetical protein